MPYAWQDLVTGRYHSVNNETGEHVPCDALGNSLPQFHHNVSGVASTKSRMALRLKDTALQRSLRGAPPKRPEALDELLLQERVATTGRFATRAPSEAALFVQQQRQRFADYPYILDSMREDEARAKHKIDELHKNYYALQASNEVGKKEAPVPVAEKPAFKNLSRSLAFSFTATGVYRP